MRTTLRSNGLDLRARSARREDGVRAAAALAATAMTLACGAPEPVAEAPYPASALVREVELDWASHQRRAPGSDNWALTWAAPDRQLATWGDGGGFGGTNQEGRVSLGVARIEGEWPDFRGTNVWGGHAAEHPAQFGGKSYGILALAGVIYLWVSPGSDADNYREARLARSTDQGATFERAPWAFTGEERIVLPTFAQFGPGYADARDGYVYVYAIRLRDGSRLAVQRPGAIDLLRVPRARVWERDAFEAFAGMGDDGAPRWSADLDTRAPVFQDPEGVGWTVSVTYDPRLRRYLLATEHHASFEGNLGLFEAPEPWGPWSTVVYTRNWGGLGSTFFWNFSRRWSAAPDGSFVLVFTGIGEHDAWNAIRGRFVTDAPAKDRSARPAPAADAYTRPGA